jgi:hypothetical protein
VALNTDQRIPYSKRSTLIQYLMRFLSPIHDLESLDFFQSSSQETISMADKYLVQLGVMICGQEVLKLTELCLKLVKLVIQP